MGFVLTDLFPALMVTSILVKLSRHVTSRRPGVIDAVEEGHKKMAVFGNIAPATGSRYASDCGRIDV